MNDSRKTKKQLIDELQSLRAQKPLDADQTQLNLNTNQLLDAITNIGHFTLSHTQLEDLLDSLAQETISASLFRSLTIFLIDKPSNSILVTRRIHKQSELNKKPYRLSLNSKNIVGVVARTNQTAVIEGWDDRFAIDTELDDPTKHDKGYDDKVSYFIPISQGNDVIAILATASTKSEKAQTLYNIKTLTPLFEQLAVAIRYAQLYQQTHQQARQLQSQLIVQTDTVKTQDRFLQAVDAIGQAILSSLDIDEILDTISNQIIQTSLFRSLTVALVKENDIEIVRTLNRHEQGMIVKHVDCLGKCYSIDSNKVFAEVVRTAKLVVIDNGRDKRLDRSTDWEDKIAYFFPVKSNNKVSAVLAVGSTIAQKAQTLQKIEAIQPLLGQLAIALQNAQLHQDMSLQIQLQKTNINISDAVQKMTSKEDLHEVLKTILTEIKNRKPDICALSVHHIIDIDSKTIETFRVNTQGKLPHSPERYNRPSLIARCQNLETVYISNIEALDALNLETFKQRMNHLPIRSFIDIPFKRGALSVHSEKSETFTEKDIEIFQTIIQPLSLGIARLEDLAYLQDHNKKQNALLQIGRSIQSMTQAKDLVQVIQVIRTQLALCQISFSSMSIHHIVDIKTHRFETFRIYANNTIDNITRKNSGVYTDWKNGKIIYRPDTENDTQGLPKNYLSNTYKKFKEQVKSMLNVPFSQGVLVLRSEKVNAFSQQDIRFVEQISETLSLGIARTEDLAKKEAQFQEIENVYRFSPIGLFVIDKDLKLLRFNAKLAEIYQLTEADIGKTLYELAPAQIQEGKQPFEHVFESGEPVLNLKVQGYTSPPPHVIKTWLANFYPLKSTNGKTERVLGAVMDITEMTATEKALEESENHLRQTLSAVPIGIILANENSEIIQTNEAALDLLGLTEDELLGKTAQDPDWNILDEEGYKLDPNNFPIPQSIRTKASIKNVYMGVYRPKTKDRIDLMVNADVLKDEQEKVKTVVCSFMDITKLRQTTKALQENEDLLRQAQHMAHVGSWTLNMTTGHVQLSEELATIYGLNPSETSTTFERIIEIVHPSDRNMIIENAQRFAETGITEDNEFRIIRPNGDIAILYGQVKTVTDSHGKIVGLMGTVQDITERKQMEKERERTQRLRALGEMAAGISHNLNNILTGVLGPAQMLQLTDQTPQNKEEIDAILTAGIRARDIVSRINKDWRIDTEILEATHINNVIQEAIRTARPRWKDAPESRGLTVEIHQHLAEVPPINGTPSGLYDIIINLIFNGVDALPKGGHIALTTTHIQDHVRLLVSDTGTGMSEEVLDRIFTPFFTTKGDVGTGLGLSTVYGTINRWGGRIDVTSKLGQGTIFTLDFPIWMGDEMPIIPPASQKPMDNAGSILIVDDEDMVTRVLKRTLSEHHVDIASSSSQALEIFASNKYDILITDLGLPHLPGDQLARQLRQKDPHLTTILISGWELLPNDSRRDHFDFFVQKPFHDLDQFRLLIANALDRKQR